MAFVHHQMHAFIKQRLGLDFFAAGGVEGYAYVELSGDELLSIWPLRWSRTITRTPG